MKSINSNTKEEINLKNFYISTKFENIESFNYVKYKLEEIGYKLVLDWTKHKNCKPYSENYIVSKIQAIEDLKAIKEADFIVYINYHKKGSGTFFELGYAYAKNKIIYIIGKKAKDASMFMCLNNIHSFDSIDEFIEYMKNKINK